MNLEETTTPPGRSRTKSPRRAPWVYLTLAGCLLTLTPTAQGETRGAGIDANALVRKMIATYQNAPSFAETDAAQIVNLNSGDYIQGTELKFKRPNQFYINSSDLKLGTYAAYCDGRYVTLYSGTQNAYTKRLVPNKSSDILTTRRETVVKLANSGKLLLTKTVNQILNPISFLTARGMPDECKNFHVVGEDPDALNPKWQRRGQNERPIRAIVVSGTADSAWLAALTQRSDIPYSKKEVKFWIDPERNVLVRAQLSLEVEGRNHASLNLLRIDEIHNVTLNAPLKDADFAFISPKGSEERFQERREVY